MRRRPLLYVLVGLVVLGVGVAVSTFATVRETEPDGPCTDRRWGCAEFEPDEDVVIGVLLPTEGPSALGGVADLASIETTIDEAGPLFGHRIRALHIDDACTYEDASAASRIFGTSESPARPPTAAVVGGICREAVVPAAQILTDTAVPFVTWYEGDLGFAEPRPRISFLIRIDPGEDVAARTTELVLEAVRGVAVRGPDGTIYVARTALRDAIRQAIRGSEATLATP